MLLHFFVTFLLIHCHLTARLDAEFDLFFSQFARKWNEGDVDNLRTRHFGRQPTLIAVYCDPILHEKYVKELVSVTLPPKEIVAHYIERLQNARENITDVGKWIAAQRYDYGHKNIQYNLVSLSPGMKDTVQAEVVLHFFTDFNLDHPTNESNVLSLTLEKEVECWGTGWECYRITSGTATLGRLNRSLTPVQMMLLIFVCYTLLVTHFRKSISQKWKSYKQYPRMRHSLPFEFYH